MAFWKRSTTAQPDRSEQVTPVPPADPRLPGIAGYGGVGLQKGAMPDMRLTFVRPDGQPDD